MKLYKLVALCIIPLILAGCSKKDNDNTNGNASAVLGEVGNKWSAKINNHNISARIISNNNGMIELEVDMEGEKDTILVEYNGNRVREFVHSGGDITKPFTMVEFDAEVGEMYSLSIEGGLYFQRDIIEKETYYIDALGKELLTIGVYEEIPYWLDLQIFGISIESIIWYWHPDYGLVCVDIYTTDGQFIEVVFVTIEL
jgi:hypothetical protein